MAKRNYENKLPSVTTIIGLLRNIPLEFWFKNNTLEFITQESNKGKEVGKDVHEAIEHYVLTGESKISTAYPEEVTNALKSFMAFRKDYSQYSLNWAETALTSTRYSFNGTIDAIGDEVIWDWKTGKCGLDKDKLDIYDSYKTQISAYTYLYNECNGTNIEKAIIVAIAKDKIAYNTYEMTKEEIEGQFNEVFLPLLRVWNYKKQKKEK